MTDKRDYLKLVVNKPEPIKHFEASLSKQADEFIREVKEREYIKAQRQLIDMLLHVFPNLLDANEPIDADLVVEYLREVVRCVKNMRY